MAYIVMEINGDFEPVLTGMTAVDCKEYLQNRAKYYASKGKEFVCSADMKQLTVFKENGGIDYQFQTVEK